MKTITLSNQKGGVAKTSTAVAMSCGLAGRDKKILAVDLDPQCNLSLSSGADILELDVTLYDVFKGSAGVLDAVTHSKHGYDLLTGGLSLAGADMEFTQTGREFMLTEALKEVSKKYDYCIIDTAPTLGILTINALTASDYVVIPLTADAYALQGLSQLSGLIQNVTKYTNKDLQIAGLLLTKHSDRTNISKAIRDLLDNASRQLETQIFKTAIRESVAVRESALLQADLFKEAPKANATIDYNDFISEFLGVIKNGK